MHRFGFLVEVFGMHHSFLLSSLSLTTLIETVIGARYIFTSSSTSRMIESKMASAVKLLRGMPPKRIVLSGPSGFLGQRVLECMLRVHSDRINHGLKPGEVVLLSSSPGRLMERLSLKYNPSLMRTIRASRVDYYTQHDERMWQDQLLSLGLEGEDCVFVNLAAVAGPVLGINDAMMHVNYRAPVAAARACETLQFGHWIQSSTQATTAERAGQVHLSVRFVASSLSKGTLQ
jgi:hypothetical protein